MARNKSKKYLEKKIEEIQRSTKTLLNFFAGPHNKLRASFSWYKNWHLYSRARLVHVSVLLIFSSFISGLIILEILSPPIQEVFAAARVNSETKISSNQLIIKFKKEKKAKLKIKEDNSINPEDTGIDSFNKINKKNKVKKIKKVIKESKKSKKDADIFDYYQIELPFESGALSLEEQKITISEGGFIVSPNSINRILDEYKNDSSIEYADFSYIYEISATIPNDQYYDQLWGLEKIGMPNAWDITTGSSDTIVAVIDTGLDFAHEDLQDNIWYNYGEMGKNKESNGKDDDGNGYVDDWRGFRFGYNFSTNDPSDVHGHGTHVAGTIAATTNNGIGVSGVSWSSKIMVIQGLTSAGSGYDTSLAPALIYAAENGADVINNSWGGPGESLMISDAISYARDMGAVVTVAAGNESDDVSNYHPAGHPDAITVSATDQNDNKASFSNFGEDVDVSAPGVSILSTLPDSTPGDIYQSWSGTSMATPHVSGLASLILSVSPNYNPDQVFQAITAYSDDIGIAGKDNYFGYGRINAARSLAEGVSLPTVNLVSPLEDSSVSGVLDLIGRAYGENFLRYELEYKKSNETDWIHLKESSVPETSDNVLYQLDTYDIEDGDYNFKLKVVDNEGQTFESIRNFKLNNVVTEISNLYEEKVLSIGDSPLDITGTVKVNYGEFTHYSLSSKKDGESDWIVDDFILQGGGTNQTNNNKLSSWDYGSNSSGAYSIRLIVYDNELIKEVLQIKVIIDRELVAGWPINPSEVAYLSSPVFNDVNNDGVKEVIFTGGGNTNDGYVYVYNKDGTPFPNWPQRVAKETIPNAAGVIMFQQPIAEDLDGDGLSEIIATTSFPYGVIADYPGFIYVYNIDGSIREGWPKEITSIKGGIWNSPAAGDLNGDGQYEIVVKGTDEKVHVFNLDGTYLDGWPKIISDAEGKTMAGSFRPSPSLFDVNRDGYLEILVGIKGEMHIFDYKGDDLVGWPQKASKHWGNPVSVFGGISSTPSVGDIDNDGDVEIVATIDAVEEAYGYVYAWERDGTIISGWPKYVGIPFFNFPSSPALADIDHDKKMEIIVNTSANNYVIRHDGSDYPGWPKSYSGLYNAPAISDINRDGNPDILLSSNHVDKGIDAYSSNGEKIFNKYYGYSFCSVIASDIDGNKRTEIAGYEVHDTGTDHDYSMYLWEADSSWSGESQFPEWPRFKQSSLQNGLYPYYAIDESPVASILSPQNNEVVSDTVDISVSAIDDKSISKVEFYIEGNIVGTEILSGEDGNYGFGWDSWSVSNGVYELKVLAFDSIGQVGESTISINVENYDAPPEVAILKPSANSSVSGTVDISATASDDYRILKLKFYIDDTFLSEEDKTGLDGNYGTTWDVEQEELGSHKIKVIAYDLRNNTNETEIGVNVVDKTKPTVALINPTEGSSIAYGKTLQIFNIVSDDRWLDRVEIFIDDKLIDTEYGPNFPTDLISSFWNFWHVLDKNLGNHIVKVVAYDKSGNSAVDSREFTIIDDTPPYNVSIYSPSSDGRTYSDVLNVYAQAFDDVSVSMVELFINGERIGQNIDSPYGFSFDTKAFPNGNYDLTVKATDTSNNIRMSQVRNINIFNIAPDDESPSVAFIQPRNGDAVSDVVDISINATDNVGIFNVYFYIDDRFSSLQFAPGLDGYYGFGWDSSNAVNGIHNIKAVAVDSAGNSREESIDINVANLDLPPEISIINPQDGEDVSSIVDISVSATDDDYVHKVEFYVNNELTSTQVSTGEDGYYGFGWNSTIVSNGHHEIKVVAYDNSDNQSEALININVSNQQCNGITSVNEYKNQIKASSGQNWKYWWNEIIPNDRICRQWLFEDIIPFDSEIYSIFWDRAVPEYWANGFYYTDFWNQLVPDKTKDSYYYNRLWQRAVPRYWTNGFYYNRLWDKAILDNWISASSNSYRNTFWEYAVPEGWAGGYYSSRLWDKAVPGFWSSGYYYKHLWDEAIPEKEGSFYYFTNFWDRAVPNYWANGYYYKRFWDKAVPSNWAASSSNPYQSTFWDKAVPETWANSYYVRILQKAISGRWASGYYYYTSR